MDTMLGAALGAALVAVSTLAVWQRARHRREIVELEMVLAEKDDSWRQEAAAATAHQQAILAGMAEGVMVVDHRRVIRMANPSLRQIFGLKADPTGQTVLTTFRLPLLETMCRAAIEERTPRQEETSVQITPGHEPTYFIISTRPLGTGSEPSGAVIVIQDISRVRKLEEVRREFVANVSHELRTPLAIFRGYLENLIDRPSVTEEELLPILKVMEKHSVRLNALVEDLLTLTRLESRRDPLMREMVELAEYLGGVTEDWQPRCAGKGVDFALELPAGPPVPLSLDPLRFRQVLDNLLDNALKYTPANGRVSLRVAASEGEVTISVADTGTGIPADHLPHIFERFYRADRARSRELGGTGLGLAIVKHIVQAHGGKVSAESILGKGTAISLTIPNGQTRTRGDHSEEQEAA